MADKGIAGIPLHIVPFVPCEWTQTDSAQSTNDS